MGPSSFNDGDAEVPKLLGTVRGRASMGPSSFNDGDKKTDSRERKADRSFNGAVVFQRRRFCYLMETRERQEWLQWGRRLSTTEMFSPDHPANAPDLASMGPSSFNDGDTGEKLPFWFAVVTLQWGRRLSTTEIVGTETFEVPDV